MNRKLDVGDTLERAFSIYGSQAGVLLPVAFVLFLLVAVVTGLLYGSILLLPLGVAITIAAATLYLGLVVELVSDVQDGRRDSSVGDLVEAVTPVLLPLMGAALLAGIAIGIGVMLFILPGLFLATIWAVIAPAIVVERRGLFGAFGRSRQLVRGHGWQVFGVILSALVIVVVARIVLAAVAVSIGDGALIRILFDILALAIVAPVAGLVVAVMYFRLRALDEGTAPDASAAGPAPA